MGSSAQGEKPVHLLPHAIRRIDRLRALSFQVSQEMVTKAVRRPDRRMAGHHGRWVAQRGYDDRHVLRVVYEEGEEHQLVVTVYLGPRRRYEG